MGPIVLFDKSFLQSLSVDESVFFDKFFLTVISPLFYVETLADLEKAVRTGRTPEREVAIIADKAPELNCVPCAEHTSMCLSSLMGQEVPMDGRIPRPGGKHIETQGKTGIFYEESPEEQALSRWHSGEFLEVERRFAKRWRAALYNVDYVTVAAGLKSFGIDASGCNSLDDAKHIADEFVQQTAHPLDKLTFAFIALGLDRQYAATVAARWEKAGFSDLPTFAPYAAYVLGVETFFHVSLAANLIPNEPNSRTDISYLFYLPFSMVFVSSDRLHRRAAPLFARSDQAFIWGPDLKTDLARLVAHYHTLPASELDKGVMHFAHTPPEGDTGVVAQLWDRYLLPWRDTPKRGKERELMKDPELLKSLQELIKGMDDSAVPATGERRSIAEVDMVSVKRSIRHRKGSFWQVSKSVK